MRTQRITHTQTIPNDATRDTAKKAWPSLELAYQELLWRYERQLEQIDGLDQKSNFGLASSTLVVAALAAFRDELPLTFDQEFLIETVLMTVAIVCYAVVLAAWYMAFRIQRYAITPKADYIVDKLVHKPPQEAKALIVNSRSKDVTKNEELLRERSMWVKVECWAFMVLVSIIISIFLLI